MLRAMVLAAGKGTRVRPLTYDIPKPMIPVLGKPVLEYLVEFLSRNGIRHVMVNTSHLGDRIERYFGDGRRFGMHIGYSFEGYIDGGQIVPDPLGSAGGMKKIHDFGGFFSSTTLVLCGDAIVNFDLASVLRAHRESGALATILATRVPREMLPNYGVVLTDDAGRVLSFQEKPAVDEALSDWVNTGIYLFEPRVLDLIPSGTSYDIGSQLFPAMVAAGLPIHAHKGDVDWLDIGRVGDFWSVMQRAMSSEVPWFGMPGEEIRPGLWAGLNASVHPGAIIEGPVYIGSGSSVGAGCRISGPTWIGHGCRISEGAQIERSVVFEHTRIHAHARLREQVVYGEYCVNREGDVSRSGEHPSFDFWADARIREVLAAA